MGGESARWMAKLTGWNTQIRPVEALNTAFRGDVADLALL